MSHTKARRTLKEMMQPVQNQNKMLFCFLSTQNICLFCVWGGKIKGEMTASFSFVFIASPCVANEKQNPRNASTASHPPHPIKQDRSATENNNSLTPLAVLPSTNRILGVDSSPTGMIEAALRPLASKTAFVRPQKTSLTSETNNVCKITKTFVT